MEQTMQKPVKRAKVNPKQYVGPTEAARMVGKSRVTFYRWLRKGVFKGVRRTPGDHYLIPVDSIPAHLIVNR